LRCCAIFLESTVQKSGGFGGNREIGKSENRALAVL
jgi:hypothetical protein